LPDLLEDVLLEYRYALPSTPTPVAPVLTRWRPSASRV
jgi:hypothetical protein